MYSFDSPRKEAINKSKSPAPTASRYNVQQIQWNILPAHFYPVISRPSATSPVIQRYVDIEAVEKAIEKYEATKSLSDLSDLNNALRYLGVIEGKISYSSEKNVYTICDETSELINFNSFDNAKSFLLDMAKDKNNIESNVLFGNEFTFRKTDGSFNFDQTALDLQGSPNKEQAEMINKIGTAGKIINVWVDKLKFLKCDNYTCNITNGNKKWKSEHYNAFRITFNDAATNVSWSFNIDLDPNCIEIQTEPISYNTFLTLQGLINASIFSIADSLRLKADENPKTGGGGHISFDVNTAFMGNAGFLRNFLVAYAKESQKISGEKHRFIVECEDLENAPYLGDLREGSINMFYNTIKEFDKLSPGKKTIKDLVSQIQQKVYYNNFVGDMENILSPRSGSKQRKVDPELAYHYQAVNLEHVSEDSGRVEMRRFNAQKSAAETIEQFQFLINLLLKSRIPKDLPT